MVVHFEALIESADRGGAIVVVPAEVVEKLGGGGRIPVQATIDGHPYRGSIAVYGSRHILGVLKSIRQELSKGPGDKVMVGLARDTTERVVEVPADLLGFLEAAGVKDRFEGLSYTKRRQAVQEIETAKSAETRQRRIDRLVQGLTGG